MLPRRRAASGLCYTWFCVVGVLSMFEEENERSVRGYVGKRGGGGGRV